MGVLDSYFPMGLGTGRLPIKNLKDTEGIEKSAELILKALDAGVSYIDTAPPYSAGGAHAALKLAFQNTDKPYSVTVKVIYQTDKTADDARRRVEMQLESLGIGTAAFFVCWSISSYGQFVEITRKGGIYDGALRLKDEGVIDHICCSLHASAGDSIEIIKSGLFEAATISFNLANSIQTLPILDAALKYNVGIAAMNPLGGGGISQNPEFFSFARASGEDTVTAALRFAKSHPTVRVVLSGISDEKELACNLAALRENTTTDNSGESNAERLERVISKVKDIEGYCVNCRYCDGCPVGIPVSKIMDRHNRLLFPNIVTQDYKRTQAQLVKHINLFFGQAHIVNSGEWFPDSPENPCTRCGQCEEKCTQKLEVIKYIDEMYTRADECGFSARAREARLRELLLEKGYKRVGLYPKDRTADFVIELYERFFGKPAFEWVAFNSDPSTWGRISGGLVTHGPDDIPQIRPDIIIVCNYTYEKNIFDDLQRFEKNGIKIVKLHREADIPWVF